MIVHKNLRLCGGTFFFLLLKAGEGVEASQDLRFKYFLGVIDPLSVNGIMDGEVDKLHTYASKFRNCQELPKKSKLMRLGDQIVCNSFRDSIKEFGNTGLDRVKEFTEKFIPEIRRPWLVRALLELIHYDDSIPGNAVFNIKPGFLPAYKEEFVKEDAEIFFYDFLLGIWFYVYENCADNTIGKNTIESLGTSVKSNVEDEFSYDTIGVNNIFDGVSIYYEPKPEVNEKTKATMTIHYADMGRVAPDLSEMNLEEDFVLVNHSAKRPIEYEKDKFYDYRTKAYYKYRNKKTFIYETERPFRDFYVCNDIAREAPANIIRGNGEVRFFDGVEIKHDARVSYLNFSRIVLIGQGGLGKTMMVNNLFLGAVEDYEEGSEGTIPILVSLNEYKPKENDLMYLITRAVTRFDPKIELSDITTQLYTDETVLLLDGMDEIKQDYLFDFIREVDYLCDSNPKCMIIISSRSIPEIRNLSGFTRYELLPLTQDQAFEMVSRLDPQYVDEKIKENFIKDIKSGRFKLNDKERREFLGNPLFLTIMLVSYSQTNNIPTKRYLFYHDAYVAMATRHDALKGISREFSTKLDVDKFQKCFGQFCADSYSDRVLKFDRPLLDKYMQKVIDDNGLQTNKDMFFKDIVQKLCLMYLDGTEYRFIHRSFQEYFTAFYFTTLLEEDMEDVYELLIELDTKIVSDETISMFYGMSDKRCEKYIIIPFLESIFANGGDEDDYRDFLLRFYPELEYVTGELDDDMINNQLRSAIYKFIAEYYEIKEEICSSDFDYEEGYADSQEKYYTVEDYRNDKEYGDCSFVEDGRIGLYTDEQGTPLPDVSIEDAGYLCTFDMSEAVNDDRWKDLLFDSLFPLYKEFYAAKELLERLKGERLQTKKKRKFGLKE